MDYHHLTINTLNSYKKLLQDDQNLPEVLKDETMIIYIATLFETDNDEILTLCIEILENIIDNDNSHDILIKTFGIFEALESLSIKLRHQEPSEISVRIENLLKVIRNIPKLDRNSKNSALGMYKKSSSTTVYRLYLEDLTPDNQAHLEQTLIKIKGLISFVMDVERKYCIVRLGQRLTIKNLAQKINDTCGMKSSLVSSGNNSKNYAHVDILGRSLSADSTSCSEYFPEENSPVAKNALRRLGNNNGSEAKNGWFKSAQDFLANSFYW